METLILVSVLISLIMALMFIPRWIKKSRKIGLLWEDMNKYGHPKNVASSGGIVVVMAFVMGVLYYIAIRTFVLYDGYNHNNISLEAFSLLLVILILAIVGLTDDLLGWNGLRTGMSLPCAYISAITSFCTSMNTYCY